MNTRIQRLGIVLLMCFLAIFVKLQQTQVLDVAKLNAEPTNQRPILRKYNKPRGAIVTPDGVVVAQSLDVGDDNTPRKRVYPTGDLFGHVTGYYARLYGATGVEKVYDADLAGDTLQQQIVGITDLFSTKENVGDIVLTIPHAVQQAAKDAMGDKQGTVVALDPRSGDILAFWSNPSFDPGLIAGGPTQAELDNSKTAYDLYNLAAGKPMLAKQYQERWPPGSTFKVVTAAVAVEQGTVRLDQPVYPQLPNIKVPPQTQPIGNFGGSVCGGNLVQIMTVSCNTAFVQMALDTGGPQMVAGAEKFGFNRKPPIDLSDPVATSAVQKDLGNKSPELGKTGIGQQDTSASPLQMALVAGAIGNNGVIMEPHVMRDVRTRDNELLREYPRKEWLRAVSPQTAATVREAMKGPVGPGGSAAGKINVPFGFEAYGKTGTAQTGDPNIVHTWFIAMLAPPGQAATVAVAVVVPNQPNLGESTGGQIAAPIAARVLEAAHGYQSQPPPIDPGASLTPAPTTPGQAPVPGAGGGGAPTTTTTAPRRNR